MVTNEWSRALHWSTPWNPFAGLERLQRDARALLAAHAGEAQPPVRVHAGASALRIDVELPGRDPADIDVALSERTLVVRGKAAPRDGADTETALAERREFTLPAFERSFQLPWNVERDTLRASFRDGVLTIELARVAQEQPRRIPIES